MDYEIRAESPVKYAPRLLGAAFLFVILTSLGFGLLLKSAAGSGNASDLLVSISNNPDLARLAILVGMLNSTGIVALAVLLYVVLKEQGKLMARVALGLWLAEAIFYAIIQLGLLALIPLSAEFVAAGAPAGSFYQTLGNFLYDGVYHQSMTIHMWFYCVGGLLWYYLFYRSNYIPRVISLFGLAAVLLGLGSAAFQLLGYEVPILLSIPLLPFELAIGAWLLFRGIREQPMTVSPARQTAV
ncbi:MAG TPA: DUF4386 domain-containing protein [Methanocella sp.]|jgi:hypothetical protein